MIIYDFQKKVSVALNTQLVVVSIFRMLYSLMKNNSLVGLLSVSEIFANGAIRDEIISSAPCHLDYTV